MSDALPRRFFRICANHPPTTWDFASNFVKGRPPRGIERTDPAEHRGISVYADARDAMHTASDFPRLGDYLAELALPVDRADLTARKTGSPLISHFTLWGAPEDLLACVRSVVPIVRARK